MNTHEDEILRAKMLQAATLLEGQREPITTIKTPLFVFSLKGLMTTLLTSHGATVEERADYTEIIFPEGDLQSRDLATSSQRKLSHYFS